MVVADPTRLSRPHDPFPVPGEDEFVEIIGGEPVQQDYKIATDVKPIYDDLLEQYDAKFAHLQGVDIALLWKAKGSKSGGKVVLGQCQRLSGLARFYAQCDFALVFSADHCRDEVITYERMRALVHHEILHIMVDDKDRLQLRPHDWEGFSDDLKEFGPWTTPLEEAVTAAFSIPEDKLGRVKLPKSFFKLKS